VLKVFCYSAYGLGIHSALPLPELTPLAEATADVLIRTGSLDWLPPEREQMSCSFDDAANRAFLSWPSVGGFRISGGSEIVIDPVGCVDSQTDYASLVRLPLLGSVFAVLLHQRGLLVLHASAVEIHGKAIAFVGPKGQGKSTIAAMLYARGHRLLADDLVAVSWNQNGRPCVLPGFPQFKLWPEAAAHSLGDDPAVLSKLANGVSKLARPVTERFSHAPAPLAAIYALSAGSAASLKQYSPQESVRQLIGNWYLSRFGDDLTQGPAPARLLTDLAHLIGEVPVLRLERPYQLSLLSEIVDLVERDVIQGSNSRIRTGIAAGRPQ
jgi:hypothetical protein